MSAFLRAYQLYIGKLPELDTKISQPNANKSDGATPSVDIRTIPKNGDMVFIEGNPSLGKQGYQLEAEIKFPMEGSGKKNITQTIKVFNPPAEMEKYLTTENVVILNAGYVSDDFLPTLCAAQIIKAQITKDGTNRIATITCSEAYSVRRNVTFSDTFDKQWTYEQGIKRILEVFAWYGVPAGTLQFSEKASTQQFGRPRPVSGSIEATLTNLCENSGLLWNITNGEINVYPKSDEKKGFINVLVVEPDNVKNTIEFLDDKSDKSATDAKTQTKGVKFTVNLNGRVNKSDGVRIKPIPADQVNSNGVFKNYEGQYLISSIAHKLSYEGNEWGTTIEARMV